MSIFDEKYSDSFYFLTVDGEKLYPVMQQNQKTKQSSFRIGASGNARTLNHSASEKRTLEVTELEMFDSVINHGFYTRIHIVKNGKIQLNYRSCSSRDIKSVIIHPDWLHLKK